MVKKSAKSPERTDGATVLLSGGNPQIAMGYGDDPVRAYIAAMPGWKSDVGRRLGGTINDVVLAVLSGALGRFLHDAVQLAR